MAAGLNASLTRQSMNGDVGNLLRALRDSLVKIANFDQVYAQPFGKSGYLALPSSTSSTDTSTDGDNLFDAVAEAMKLHGVYFGTATVGSDGTVTTGTTGHNFDTTISKVTGDGASLS